MTPRSLFVIILKIMGILMISQVIYSGFNLVGFAISAESNAYMVGNLIGAALSFSVLLGLCWLLLFRSAIILDRLGLDKGFYEEQFSMNMDKTMMIRIGLICVGLYFIIDALPDLANEAIDYLRGAGEHLEQSKSYGFTYWCVKVIIGYLMLANSSYVANYIANKDKSITNEEV